MDNANLEMYADPINYDRESSFFDPDGSILLELARQASGPVLELGCGTGRVTIPLAQRGIVMTGLEIVPQMIEYAQEKSQGLPIQWVCDDVRTFQLDTQYALIFTYGAVFQHMLNRSDQEAMLARVHEHLAPGGKFIIDMGFKHPLSMVNSAEKEEWYTFTDKQGREVNVAGTDEFDHIQQIWYQTLYRRWQEGNETKSAPPVTLTLRYFMPQEMDSLLSYNGFHVLSRYSDWNGSPVTEESFTHIYVCTLRP